MNWDHNRHFKDSTELITVFSGPLDKKRAISKLVSVYTALEHFIKPCIELLKGI